jgi:hypothetical protein
MGEKEEILRSTVIRLLVADTEQLTTKMVVLVGLEGVLLALMVVVLGMVAQGILQQQILVREIMVEMLGNGKVLVGEVLPVREQPLHRVQEHLLQLLM